MFLSIALFGVLAVFACFGAVTLPVLREDM